MSGDNEIPKYILKQLKEGSLGKGQLTYEEPGDNSMMELMKIDFRLNDLISELQSPDDRNRLDNVVEEMDNANREFFEERKKFEPYFASLKNNDEIFTMFSKKSRYHSINSRAWMEFIKEKTQS